MSCYPMVDTQNPYSPTNGGTDEKQRRSRIIRFAGRAILCLAIVTMLPGAFLLNQEFRVLRIDYHVTDIQFDGQTVDNWVVAGLLISAAVLEFCVSAGLLLGGANIRTRSM